MSVRCCAAKAWGQLGDLRAIDLLINALNNSEWEMQKAATLALGELIIELLKHRDCKVRQKTAYVLGQVGDVRAVEPLISALLNDSDLFVREFAARSLERIGDKRAIKPLLDVFKQEYKDSNLRSTVAWVLSKMDASADS
jgi:HEAT repeat protein